MTTRNHKQEAPKEQLNKQETKPDSNPITGKKGNPLKADTDMEPDEFLAPNADTDLPIDHHVANDSVLHGEDHADEKGDNQPSGDK